MINFFNRCNSMAADMVTPKPSRVASQDIKVGYEVYHGGNIHKVVGVRKVGDVVHCETKHGHVSFPFGCPVICYEVKK